MMKFIPLTEKYPEPEELVLVKLKPNPWFGIGYYVVRYGNNYRECFNFIEAAGEEYSYWEDDQILGWMPIKELDNIPFTRKEV